MTRTWTMIAAGCLVLALAAPPAPASDVFPFPYKIEQLENGLKVVSIPLSNPDIIAYYTIVRSGSRNEVEPGKSGFAHFFEHMMFKGTKAGPPPRLRRFSDPAGRRERTASHRTTSPVTSSSSPAGTISKRWSRPRPTGFSTCITPRK